MVVDRDRGTVAFDRAGVELDLGGIAKGYAVDRARSVLARAGVTAALVSAGGSTLYAMGAPPGQQGWEIALEDPIRPARIVRKIRLRDRALSVAGSRGRFFEAGGVSYSHIMDPRTGRPVRDVLGVAVVTDTGVLGDALDDAFFVLGVDGHPGVPEAPRADRSLLVPARGTRARAWSAWSTEPTYLSAGRRTTA